MTEYSLLRSGPRSHMWMQPQCLTGQGVPKCRPIIGWKHNSVLRRTNLGMRSKLLFSLCFARDEIDFHTLADDQPNRVYCIFVPRPTKP